MIYLRTGVAPFRGFVQERGALSKTTTIAETVLFYGCRADNEYMYKQEFLDLSKEFKEITIHCAYSRQKDQKKKYVQDLLKEEVDLLKRTIGSGGVVYVCGDGNRMAQDVWKLFIEVFGGEVMDKMKKELRYLEDVWS